MNTCPAEITSQIFSLACTDGGGTGRSLSQVSKYVRAVSTPFRWQTLAISGLEQASAFVSFLETEPETYPIHHLFLSDRREDEATDQWTTQTSIFISRHDTYPTVYSEEAARRKVQYDQAQQWGKVQRKIVEFAASTLKTLTFLSFDLSNGSRWFGELLNVHYPHLTELYVRNRWIVFRAWDIHSMPDLTSTWCPMPTLKRLHLAFSQDFDTTRLLIHSVAPHITHLRLSGVERDRKLSESLHAELSSHGIVPSVLPPFPRELNTGRFDIIASNLDPNGRILPSTLEKLIVQPLELPPSDLCSCCSGYVDTYKMTHILREMARGRSCDKFVFLPEIKRPGYSYRNIMLDWLNRAEGGAGCW